VINEDSSSEHDVRIQWTDPDTGTRESAIVHCEDPEEAARAVSQSVGVPVLYKVLSGPGADWREWLEADGTNVYEMTIERDTDDDDEEPWEDM
jgi:hypothetical protein